MWSESLGDWSLGVIRHLSLSIVASLPGLMIVVLIFLLTWLIIRLVKVVLDQSRRRPHSDSRHSSGDR